MRRGKRRGHLIDGDSIFVFDDLFSNAEIERVHRFVHQTSFRWSGEHYIAEFDPQGGDVPVIIGKVETRLAQIFPGERFKLRRSYCENINFGNATRARAGCPPSKRDVTATLHLNPCWDAAWGAETLFFNREGDAVAPVSYRPGRLALFRARLVHRNEAPLRACFLPRLSFNFDFEVRR